MAQTFSLITLVDSGSFTKIENIRGTKIYIIIYVYMFGDGGGEGSSGREITCCILEILNFRYLKWNIK